MPNACDCCSDVKGLLHCRLTLNSWIKIKIRVGVIPELSQRMFYAMYKCIDDLFIFKFYSCLVGWYVDIYLGRVRSMNNTYVGKLSVAIFPGKRLPLHD